MKKLTSIVCSRGLIAAALIGAGHSIAFAQDTYGDRLNIGLGHILTGTYSSIAGGTNNTINAPFATIGGGVGNRNDSTYGFVGAGNANVNQGYAAVTVGGESNVNTNDYSFVGGGTVNTNLGNLAVIVGGVANYNTGYGASVVGGLLNQVFDDLSFIGGGEQNTTRDAGGGGHSFIGGGIFNTVSTNYAFIGGGWGNSIGGSLGFIGGGYINTNNALGGTIAGGVQNVATGSYSTIAGGAQAVASLYGQSAHANGGFTSPGGDAQASDYVLRGTSTGTNTAELFLNGASERMTTPTAGTWTFDILVAARSSNGDSAGFRTNGVIKNVGGTVTLLSGQKTLVPFVSDFALSGSRVILSATSNALAVSVKGTTTNGVGLTNRWVATVHTSEVKY